MNRFHIALPLLLLTLPVMAAEPSVNFARDVRPILAENCFACHGPDEKHRKADVRFDTQAGLKEALAEVLPRITSKDSGELMPPPKSGKTLKAAEIDILKRWIADGGKWSSHWAFEAVQRPTVPAFDDAKSKAWVRNDVDAFVLARLKREGIAPSPEASKTTLIRRLSLDLIGLPPTPAEVDAFVNDASPNAYEKLVDRLLASPHYGERMAMQWLDYARYADSNGFQTDTSRSMWPWRDWVIRSFNTNKPFDQFTIEQIAGDMLPNATREQVVGTGFNRNHRLNGEGGLIAAEWRIETVIDRVETTSLTWLGLTAGCARCHDHKYDPISQKEFYQLFAFFNNVPESGTLAGGPGGNTAPTVTVGSPEQETELARLTQVIQAAEAKVKAAEKDLPKLLAAWEPRFREQMKNMPQSWNVVAVKEAKSAGGATLTLQRDGSYLAGGKNPPNDTYIVTAPVAAGNFTGLLLECFPDASLPEQSVGRFTNGNFVLTKVEAEITTAKSKTPIVVKFNKVSADFSQQGWDVQSLLGKGKGWAADGPTRKQPLKAMLLSDKPVSVPADSTITIRLKHEAIAGHNIGRFRLSVSGKAAATLSLKGESLSAGVRRALDTPREKRTPADQAELEQLFRTSEPSPIQEADRALAAAIAARDAEEKKGKQTVMVMKEGPTRETHILKRGQYDQPGDKVSAALPAALPPLPAGESANRLGLARWIASKENPLTARVWINRTWERFFGLGFVKASDNLGTQTDFPSHPDLLDYLATEFMRLNWDMKAIQKLIAMSATYRQSSAITPEMLQRDPENRLLARASRFRLQGEVVRDQALAAAGVLVPTLGGPSVRPYMPNGVWDETSVYGDLRNYKHDKGPNLHRRTLYTIWKRTAAPPTMLLFDMPNREICSVKRSRTNTPLQALALLNEVTYVEAARKLAERMLTQGTTDAERLSYGFQIATARKPTVEELAILTEGLKLDRERFTKNPDAANKLLAIGDTVVSKTANRIDLAAFTLSANVLLNLDEMLTRE